ncbi:hypothetical protein AB7M45_001688 [Bradyrhizobium elkanii]
MISCRYLKISYQAEYWSIILPAPALTVSDSPQAAIKMDKQINSVKTRLCILTSRMCQIATAPIPRTVIDRIMEKLVPDRRSRPLEIDRKNV